MQKNLLYVKYSFENILNISYLLLFPESSVSHWLEFKNLAILDFQLINKKIYQFISKILRYLNKYFYISFF